MTPSDPGRVARRVAMRYAGMTVLDLDVAADKVEDVLQMLVDGIDDLEDVEKELGLDVRNLVRRMGQFEHNDDVHHHGETVLRHTKEVLEDLDKLTEGMDAERRQVLRLAALLHDVGKAYTHEILDGKHTFYEHAKKSVEIAEKMLAGLARERRDLYDRVLDLVRLHDTFMTLLASREQSKGSLRYLNKFRRERIVMEDNLDDLVTLTKADAGRARRLAETLEGIDGIFEDLRKVEERDRAELARRERAQANAERRKDEVRALFETEGVGELADLLPDISAVNRELGKRKLYNLLKGFKQILSK